MKRAEKELSVAERHEALNEAESVIVAQYTGLTVAQMTNFRVGARAEGVSLKVAKNRLVLRALKGTAYEGIGSLLKGPVALATSKDPVAAARIVFNFAKNNERLVVLGGAIGAKLLSNSDIEYLAKLPSLDGLRGKIVGILQAPAAQLARVTKAYADKV